MALFSRRKKSADEPARPAGPAEEAASAAEAVSAETDAAPEAAPSEAAVPEVNISVQAFRGVGEQAGPEVALPDEQPASSEKPARPATAPAAPTTPQGPPKLPLAPALPPERTQTVDGMDDNVLLREALGRLEEGATNAQLLGVMRQALQGHLYLRVLGDARAQIAEGKQLQISVVRDDSDRAFTLAFSSGAALRASVQDGQDGSGTSAIAQPATAVLKQVVDGGFAGIILDNFSAPHRAVLPVDLLKKALEQADEAMAVKTLLAGPRDEDTPVRVAEALAGVRSWVAVSEAVDGRPAGIAEARTTDGRRFLQVFSHPLEIVALGRGDRPMPFPPEQLAKVLNGHDELAGVLVDPAGPSMAIERDALSAVLVLALELD